MPEAITEQMEEYLETIYRLEMDDQVARTGKIAGHLNVTPQTVTDMIQKLERAELVVYQPYRGVALTDSGRDLAKRQLEKHRVMQAFLQEVCGMPHAEAHEAACDMEHYIPEALDRWMQGYLNDRLGTPFDPSVRVRDQIME